MSEVPKMEKKVITICVECTHCEGQSNKGDSFIMHNCVSHTKYEINPVTGVDRLSTKPVKCCNKNKGNCPDFEKISTQVNVTLRGEKDATKL